jgi:hypothetical protein
MVSTDRLIPIQKVKRKVWNPEQSIFEENTYLLTPSLSTRQFDEVKKWLTAHYGREQYQNTWWATYNRIGMSEKVYLYYTLTQE